MTVIDSSRSVRFIRTVVAGSALCAGVAAIAAWCRSTREPIVTGLGGRWLPEQASRQSRRLERIAGDSRFIAFLWSALNVPSIARRGGVVREVLTPVLNLDRVDMIRMAACAVLVAVATHTVLLAVLDVPVGWLGWSFRILLIAAGATAFKQPAPLAAAWADRSPRGRRA